MTPTPDDHYREAERLLRPPHPGQPLASEPAARIAQVHAILALAGYTRIAARSRGSFLDDTPDAPWFQR